jgi:NAD(P)-dependent dehydrogenase (short-subunit alcohol dehydrogenase family)
VSGVEGRVALVTGAGRGIGHVTAKLLAEHGAAVMGASRTEAELQTLGLDYVVGDLGDAADCVRVAAETEERLGPIDILVCNHGIGSAEERVVWEQDPHIWDETMRVNLDGPFHITRAVVGGMVERGYGRCVYVSSTAGQLGSPASSAYVTSKHGLIGLMRSVAQDAGHRGVTANAVLPGWVRTEMANRSAAEDARRLGISDEEIWAERAASYPPKRVVEPLEVAQAILFLAGEESRGISGEAITVALGSHW